MSSRDLNDSFFSPGTSNRKPTAGVSLVDRMNQLKALRQYYLDKGDTIEAASYQAQMDELQPLKAAA